MTKVVALRKINWRTCPTAARKSVKTNKDFIDYWVERYDKLKTLTATPEITTDAPVELKPKLKINTPGDKYEQEADRVAEQVMRMPEPKLQRQCACGKSPTDGECSECKKKKQEATGSLQRVAHSHVGGITAPPIVNEVLSSPGSPLPTSTRSFMESRFGQDFSHVRVHTDHRAAESAAAVQARAYTVGNNIVFGHSESPARDLRLMAHELTHVLQQSSRTQLVNNLDESTLKTQPSVGMVSRAPSVSGIGPDDLRHISELAKELAEVFPKSVKGKITVAVAIVEDSEGFRTLVYAVNRNGTSKALREKAAALGIERWDPIIDRKGIKAARRAYWHAEQLIIEAATENDFRVLAVAPSNKACKDCAEAAHAEDADLADPKRSRSGVEKIEKDAVESGERTAGKKAEKGIAETTEKAAAHAIEHQAVREVGEHSVEGAARVAKERMPKIIGRRLARLAASKTAKRALSLAPIVGWGFSAKDAWAGMKDAMHGHVSRGLAGIGCAAGDVASDLLHGADVLTGPGGTAASLAIQAGTITCQVVIELERSKERMQELQQEIERTGKLPPDERLKDYYEMDDEAIKELKESMQAPAPEKQKPPLPTPSAPNTPSEQTFDPTLPMV
ncbi:MAG: DUF4157 domain-containing protein [Planctomycetaceae bacterium]